MPEKPNILYIFTDQQAAGAMSYAGNDDLSTPAMDSMAENGVLFKNAYCTQPLCSPARASMFTGLTSHEAGVPFNNMSIREDLRDRSMGVLLGAAAYECAYAGKWHLGGGSVTEGHGFAKISERGDDHIAERSADFLRQEHQKPFLLVASFVNPHDICQWARSQTLPLGPVPEPSSVEECPSLPTNFAIPPFEPEVLRIEQAANPRIYPSVRFSDEHWRRYRYAYYRLVEKVDAQVGRILDALREQGLEENTLVIFSSDHGDGHGAHRWNQKTALYEEIVRVPFIVSWKGVTKAGHVDADHLVSNGFDLLPTVCDYAGIEAPDGLPGRSLRPLVEGDDVETWHDQVVAKTRFEADGKQQTEGWMVRTNRYKYVVYNWGQYREQLFDMAEDPGEKVNLAVSSRHGAILDEHRERLRNVLRETGAKFDVPGA